MNRTIARLIFLCLALLLSPARAATPGLPVTNTLSSGAKVMFCVPTRGWNGKLVVWAHGYTSPFDPLDFQDLQFGDIYLPDFVQRLGFAFATTSYRTTGLAVVPGVEDVRDTALAFAQFTKRTPLRTLLVGASEGGLVTTLAIERYPDIFSGGLAMCGPIGDFPAQTDYFATFRLLFDYYYPGLLPGNATNIPPQLIQHWDDQYEPLAMAAINADPRRAMQLLGVAQASFIPFDMDTVRTTVDDLLWYHTFASNDAETKLGGNPFGNLGVQYTGSSNDTALNATILRIAASPQAINAEQAYQTSGRLTRPLVTMHTIGDDVVPFWHENLYWQKVRAAGTARYVRMLPVARYGHCNFGITDLLLAISLLVNETN